MTRKWSLLALSVAVVSAIIGVGRLHELHEPPRLLEKTSSLETPIHSPRTDVQHRAMATPVSSTTQKKEVNYRQLARDLLPRATAGSASDQYKLASALHYCEENWHSHFFSRSTGKERSSEEMKQLFMQLPDNTQSLLNEASIHCGSFIEDLDMLKTSSAWLDKAAANGYPAAVFLKAQLAMQAHLVDGDSDALLEAKSQAVLASTSEDPEILFGMANFVDGSGKTREEAGRLIAAWRLVGCDKGYDCSANSEAMQGICTVDPQCANKPTVVQLIQYAHAADYGQVQMLAEQIKTAIDSRDPSEVKKYL